MRLHFTMGCYDRRWASRRRQSFQFTRNQNLFADHVHRRSGVYKQILVPQVKDLMLANTNFPKVRRMLLFHAPLFLIHFRPASPLLRGHLALATLSLPETRSSKFWSIGVTLMRITWANHSNRWILVLNVSITYHGFGESNTSDWLPHVWALPQDRWRLRRLHIFKYATQLSCNFST